MRKTAKNSLVESNFDFFAASRATVDRLKKKFTQKLFKMGDGAKFEPSPLHKMTLWPFYSIFLQKFPLLIHFFSIVSKTVFLMTKQWFWAFFVCFSKCPAPFPPSHPNFCCHPNQSSDHYYFRKNKIFFPAYSLINIVGTREALEVIS